MRRSAGLFWRVFLGVVSVALGVVTLVGLLARWALKTAFADYLSGLAQPRMGMGRGRQMMLGAAEQTFLATVDMAVLISAGVAIALAVVAAWLIARSLARPVRELEDAAHALADGDLRSRVQPAGPHEIQALGEAFNRMADSLQRAEELRRRLVSDVAHELRNPIAAARAQAEGMAEGILAVTPERIQSVTEDMEHLTALVDDLQELALAEAGQLSYDRRDIDIADLARREAERARALAAAGVEVVADVRVPEALVNADERRISEVLRNLLANGVRHTVRGSITVDVAVDGDFAVVRVIDTGEGIPAEDLENVFERFYRADAARASSTGGAGLGLAIARRIVEDHGGSVFAEQTPGGGATVGFTLPLAEGPQE